MKCQFCGKEFKPENNNQKLCDDCKFAAEEFSNGKGDDDEDE